MLSHVLDFDPESDGCKEKGITFPFIKHVPFIDYSVLGKNANGAFQSYMEKLREASWNKVNPRICRAFLHAQLSWINQSQEFQRLRTSEERAIFRRLVLNTLYKKSA